MDTPDRDRSVTRVLLTAVVALFLAGCASWSSKKDVEHLQFELQTLQVERAFLLQWIEACKTGGTIPGPHGTRIRCRLFNEIETKGS